MQLTPQQRQEVIAYVERVAWGDIEGAVKSVDEALRLAISLTRDDFRYWEDTFEDSSDEFTLARTVDSLDPPERLALLARLIRSVAVCWGMKTELGGSPGEICWEPYHAAAPARDLLSITAPDYRK
jgi:hypothetical protein